MSLLANQRARSATEIVDASVQFCRAHALSLCTIAAIVTVPPAVAAVFVPEGLAQLAVTIGENILFTIGGAAVSVYATTLMTEGEISVGETFRRTVGRTGSVIAAQILFGLAVMFGLLLIVVPGIIFLVRYGLGTTVAAVEGTDSSQSLKRSWSLTKGHAMHVFWTMTLSLVIALLLFLGGAFVMGALSGALGVDDSLGDLFVVPIMMIVAPFVWMVVTFLYIDVRVRVEGADIAAMVAELPSANPPTRQPANP